MSCSLSFFKVLSVHTALSSCLEISRLTRTMIFSPHLAGVIGNKDTKMLSIESDDKKALRNATHKAFPNPIFVVFARHLQHNVTDYLQNKVGISSNNRVDIAECLFRERAKDMTDLEAHMETVQSLCQIREPQLGPPMRGCPSLVSIVRMGLCPVSLGKTPCCCVTKDTAQI